MRALFNDGFREVTLLGQNVDSYHWVSPAISTATREAVTFAMLLEKVALISPLLRVRFFYIASKGYYRRCIV
jgi:tRNA-2-methylthio-N6-dimethylallyladenosine synthase